MKQLLPYLGPVIGLTGVGLALYFHAESIQERIPTYLVSPQRAVIVDARTPAPSDLQVLYKGKAVSSGVTAALVYFWNDGRLPMKSSEILGAEPLRIVLGSASEILEAKLVKVSRPVTKLSTGTVSEGEKDVLPITFDILERYDGAAIQIVYAGPPAAKITMTGTVVGAGAPRALTPRSEWLSPVPFQKNLSRRTKLAVSWTFAVALTLLAVFNLYLSIQLGYYRPFRLSQKVVLDILMLAMYFGLAGYSFYIGIRSPTAGVPASIWVEQ